MSTTFPVYRTTDCSVVIMDEVRRALGLPRDCGFYDPMRDTWRIDGDELRQHDPRVYKILFPQPTGA